MVGGGKPEFLVMSEADREGSYPEYALMNMINVIVAPVDHFIGMVIHRIYDQFTVVRRERDTKDIAPAMFNIRCDTLDFFSPLLEHDIVFSNQTLAPCQQ